MSQLQTSLDQHGYAVIPDVLAPNEIQHLIQAISLTSEDEAVRKRSGVYAIRNLLDLVPSCSRIGQ